MKILFITSAYPEDIQICKSGIFQRMKMFMSALNNLGDLDVLIYVPSDADISPEFSTRIEQSFLKYWDCKTRVYLSRKSEKNTADFPFNFPFIGRVKDWWFVHPMYYWIAENEHLTAFYKCLERKPDVIFVHRLNSIYPVLSSRKAVPPVFFDLDDIEHKAYVRDIKQPPLYRSKFFRYLKFPSLLLLELRAITLSKKTFVCSDFDKDYLVKTFQRRGVITIPNAVDIPPLGVNTSSPHFLFIGQYLYAPNVIAADYLVKKVWPIVIKEIPEAKLIIAGKNPEFISSYHAQHEGVEFRGFVDDLDALYREIRIVCCPILSGGGTRVKIIEAAAYGKGIVSTSLGAEGLDFVDGNEILISDGHMQFAQACITLIRDKSLCDRIGYEARRKAIELYSRNQVINRIMTEIMVPDLCASVSASVA